MIAIRSKLFGFCALGLIGLCTSAFAGGKLLYILDADRHILFQAAAGDLGFYMSAEDFQNRDILEILPFEADVKAAHLEVFNALKVGETRSIVYQLNNMYFIADIEKVTNILNINSYVMSVTKLQDMTNLTQANMKEPMVHAWTFNEQGYSAVTSYNRAKVDEFNEISLRFHKANWMRTEEALRFPSTPEVFDIFASNVTMNRDAMISMGDARLMLVRKLGLIIGGAYILEEAENVRISSAGFKIDLEQEEILSAQTEIIKILTSKENFPRAKKLVACVQKNSGLIGLLKAFNFTESNEALEPG